MVLAPTEGKTDCIVIIEVHFKVKMSLLKFNIIVMGNQVPGWFILFDTRDYVNVLGGGDKYTHYSPKC